MAPAAAAGVLPPYRRLFPMPDPLRRSSPPPSAARDACVVRPDPSGAAPLPGIAARDGDVPGRRRLLGLAAGALAASALPRGTHAQVIRSFPATARLGRLEMRIFPEAVLNQEPVRLAASARIHDADNRIVMPSTLSGALDVLVERDAFGQVARVWILTPGELAAARERERAGGAR